MATRKNRKLVRRRRQPGVVAEVAAAYGVTVPAEAAVPALSPNQIGEIMGVTGDVVKNWIYKRQLPTVKLANGFWKVRKTDLERFIRARAHGAKRRIVIVGPDAETLRPLCEATNTEAYEVVATSQLADALLKTQDLHPALLIADISGWADGWALLEKVHTLKAGRSLPVLLIAGAMQAVDTEKAMQLGVKSCLTKPVSADTLRCEIDRIMTRYL